MTATTLSEPLTHVDAAWLHMEDPTNLMMVTGVLRLGRPIAFPALVELLAARLLRYPRFRERVLEPGLFGTAPRWEEDPHFDVRAHVHRLALPSPHGEKELRELVSDLMSAPLDFTKPLWQFHLVEGVGEGCVVVARLHHAIGDGVALMNVLLGMSDEAEAERAKRQAAAGPAREEPSLWQRLAELPAALLGNDAHLFAKALDEEGVGGPSAASAPLATLVTPALEVVRKRMRAAGETLESVVAVGTDAVRHPARLVNALSRGLGGVDAFGKLLTLGSEPKTVLKGPLGSRKLAAWSRGIAVDDVKAVGKLLHGTVNDVLLTAAAGALRRYLLERGENVLDLDLHAVVPVNLRAPAEEPVLGNDFGLVFLALPVGVEDPVERLEVLKDRMDEIKKSPEAVIVHGLLDAFGRAPVTVEQAVVNLFGSRATAVMTNVPGPRTRLSMAGAPLTDVMFWVPQSGRLGLGLSILSYAGQVSIGVATDAGLVPDPERIVADFEKELRAFFALVRKERRARATTKTTKARAAARKTTRRR